LDGVVSGDVARVRRVAMSNRKDGIIVAVAGICGRMGREAAVAILDRPGMELRLGLERAGHPVCGRTIRIEPTVPDGSPAEVPVVDPSSGDLAGARVLVDFSSAEAAPGYAERCASMNVAYVGGVTGISEEGMETLRRAAERVAVVYSPNMSAGVNLLARLVEEAARSLPEGYDVEIVETHHRAKRDVPSGTAAMLARRAAEARGLDEGAIEISRPAGMGVRKPGAIAVHSLRGGDVVGDHTVSLFGLGETLTISHRAHSRRAFAGGVPPAVEFAFAAGPGFYSMDDVLR
jgi:4-hydroxy-tetrahydrodipicolinate reductase